MDDGDERGEAAGGRGATASVWRSSPWPRRAVVAAAQDGSSAAVATRRGPGDGARSLGVTAATLSGWPDALLAAGAASLTTRLPDGDELAIIHDPEHIPLGLYKPPAKK